MSTIPAFELNDGNRILQLGFGVAQIPLRETSESVLTALEVGYRGFDTAHMISTSGRRGGLRASAVPRAQLFLTGKLDNPSTGPTTHGGPSRRPSPTSAVEYLDCT